MPINEELSAVASVAATGDNGTMIVAQGGTNDGNNASPDTAALAQPVAGKKRKEGTAKNALKVTNAKPQQHHNHPPYGDMIKAALQANQDKKGSSRAAILKYIMQNYAVGENVNLVNAHLRLGLKRGVESGALKQMKGTGASGSFRLADGKPEAAKRAKKPAAKKVAPAGDMKMPSPKKAAKTKSSPKKAAAKPKTAKAKSSPKKKGGVTRGKAKAKSKKMTSGSPKKTKAKQSKAKTMKKKPTAAGRSKKVATA